MLSISDPHRVQARIDDGPFAGDYTLAPSVCNEPACGCTVLTLEIENGPHFEGGELVLDLLSGRPGKSPPAAMLPFVRAFLTGQDGVDRDCLWRVFRTLKWKCLSPDVELEFPFDSVEREGMFIGFDHLAPALYGWRCEVDGEAFEVLDSYCVNSACDCPAGGLTFCQVEASQRGDHRGFSVEYDYKTGKWSDLQEEDSPVPPQRVLQVFLQRDDVRAEIPERRRLLREVYGRNLKRHRAAQAERQRAAAQPQPGRNDPCHCGSGKKYKKCCQKKDQQATAAPQPVELPKGDFPALNKLEIEELALPSERPGGPARYTFCRRLDHLDEWDRKRLSEAALEELSTRWTPKRMAAISTDDLVERLRSFGIDDPVAELQAAAGQTTNAWAVGADWCRRLFVPLHDDDFVCLAACELWQRSLPDTPSDQEVYDWVDAGYGRFRDGKVEAGFERWQKVWAAVRSRVPEGGTLNEANRALSVSWNFQNWVQDFLMEYEGHAHDTDGVAVAGVAFVEDVFRLFPEMAVSGYFRSTYAELLWAAGRQDDATALCRKMIDEHPEQAVGYVVLSDFLRRSRRVEDHEEAQRVLKQAIDYPVVDGDDWDLQARYQIEPVSQTPGDR